LADDGAQPPQPATQLHLEPNVGARSDAASGLDHEVSEGWREDTGMAGVVVGDDAVHCRGWRVDARDAGGADGPHGRSLASRTTIETVRGYEMRCLLIG